jgi:hypothetical protein
MDHMNGTTGFSPWPSEPTAQVVVLSSSGEDAYHVTLFAGRKDPWECECSSWKQRRDCKHIGIARRWVRSDVAPHPVVSIWRDGSWDGKE